MKKLYLFSLLSICVNHNFLTAQELKLELTEEGKLEVEKITDLPNKSSSELYKQTIEWIRYSFQNTEQVIQAKDENKMIRIRGQSPEVIKGILGAKWGLGYTIQFDIKNEKIRFWANNIYFYDNSGTSSIEYHIVKKNGKLRPQKLYVKMKNDADKELSFIYQIFSESLTNKNEDSSDW